jgi:DNA polymerase I-like protein with 3'-5' exonuclease and polymerase domains
VTTLGGRRRWLPSLSSSNASDARRAERQCLNTLCQGSAADLIKQAMIAIDAVLVGGGGGGTAAGDAVGGGGAGRGGLPVGAPAGGVGLGRAVGGSGGVSGRLLLQVHDELVFEVEASGAAALRAAVSQAMVGDVTQLAVPLRVVFKQGASLGALHVVHEAMSQPVPS